MGSENIIDIDSRKVRERTSERKLARLNAMRHAEAEHAVHDDVVHAAVHATTAELLRVQVVELSREAAALRWERERSSDARERQRLSSRRIRALRTVAMAVVELNKLEDGEPSPRVVARVLDDLQGLVEGCVAELFDAETAERCIGDLRARLGSVFDQVLKVSAATRGATVERPDPGATTNPPGA